MDGRFERQLGDTDPGFRALVLALPPQRQPHLPPDWLRCEMLERYQLLRQADIGAGRTVLEVGTGAHAIATIPLAHLLGPAGRLLAVERRRWGEFRAVVRASGLAERIRPIGGDARQLPVRSGAADLAACVHGLRSLGNDDTVTGILREMLRVAPRVMLAETLPIARTDAQRAHLAMYNLREELFLATTGRADDLRYRTLDQIVALVERAGGVVESARTIEVDLPHGLAFFPREMTDAIRDPIGRAELAARWDQANAALARFGEDHPPVGLVIGGPR